MELSLLLLWREVTAAVSFSLERKMSVAGLENRGDESAPASMDSGCELISSHNIIR